jgi:hypothetical protein
MTTPNPFPAPEPGIDAVVRASLDAAAGRSDAGALAARVLARLDADAPVAPARPAPRRVWRRAAAAAGVAALAAAVLVAVFAGSGPREVLASPADVVQAARARVVPDETRCYRVTLDLPDRARDAFPLLARYTGPRTVCTRGDRFVVEPGFTGRGAWGRDAAGRVWFAPTADEAASFDPAELPPALRTAVQIHALELQPLLDEVLADFDLSWSATPSREADTFSIAATRRGEAGPLRLVSADLVVEKDTKVIRSLALARRGLSDGTAALTFVLQSAGPRDDAAFTAAGHLRPDAPVYDRSNRPQRRRLIVRHIGEILTNGL